jgi:hypothetical protein
MVFEEEPEVQSDEVSRRMAEVIDEVESVRSETVTPHWEVVENDEGEPTIYHLHDGSRVQASIVSEGSERRLAKCSEDGQALDLGAAPALARR